jgi:uncharacterized protein (DUF342 family)
MPKRDEYAFENILKSSESVLEDLGDLDSLTSGLPEEMEERIRSDKQQEELESLERSLGLKSDGYVDLRVEQEGMICAADFYPPTPGGEPLDLHRVEQHLDARKISFGADWNAIKEAVFKCNTEGVEITDVVVARGLNPVNEIPQHLELEEKYLVQEPETEQSEGKIDYKQRTPFVLVQKGDVLARLVPPVEGVMGTTVLGESIAYKTSKPRTMKPGKNTEVVGDRVVAEVSGRFEHTPGSFWVAEVLQIRDAVDYRTGHIDFPGDVILYGEVSDGFNIRAGGAIICRRTLDVSEVVCEKDLIVDRGIIGRKPGTVRVGGELRARFIENCYVEAEGSITVATGILNSAIHTKSRIDTDLKGIIVGGKLYALGGVTATQIGTRMGPRTEIYCGIDFSILQKLEWIRDRNMELAFKLAGVDQKLKKDGAGAEKLSELRDKLKAAIHKLNGAAQSLIVHLDKQEDAEVVVRRSIFPGAYIEICHVPYIITQEMRAVRFVLDKEKGRIVVKAASSGR